MARKTLTEQFEPLTAGRYTGSPGVLWQQLGRSWYADSVLDITEDSRRVQMADGSFDLTSSLHDAIDAAINARDHVRMLVLCDQAEEAGVGTELCDLTRRAIRVQYPAQG